MHNPARDGSYLFGIHRGHLVGQKVDRQRMGDGDDMRLDLLAEPHKWNFNKKALCENLRLFQKARIFSIYFTSYKKRHNRFFQRASKPISKI